MAQAARDRVELARIGRIGRDLERLDQRREGQARFDIAQIQRQHRFAGIGVELEHRAGGGEHAMDENEMAIFVGDARRIECRRIGGLGDGLRRKFEHRVRRNAVSDARIAAGGHSMPMRVTVAIVIPKKFPSS
jgi:hypothetical protein